MVEDRHWPSFHEAIVIWEHFYTAHNVVSRNTEELVVFLRTICFPSDMGLYKSECIETSVFHDGPWRSLADVEAATAAWVTWYNHERLHGTLGMVPPIEFEAAHYTTRASTQKGA